MSQIAAANRVLKLLRKATKAAHVTGGDKVARGLGGVRATGASAREAASVGRANVGEGVQEGLGRLRQLRGGLGPLAGRAGSAIRANPARAVATGLIAADGPFFAYDVLGEPFSDASDVGRGDRLFEALSGEMRAQMLAAVRARRLQKDAATNMSRIVAQDPEFAQSLIAGRMLPQGATRIGGRVDGRNALSELAMMSALGTFDTGPTPETVLQLSTQQSLR